MGNVLVGLVVLFAIGVVYVFGQFVLPGLIGR